MFLLHFQVFCLTIIYAKLVSECKEPVKVETLLLQIGHKKRKDVSSPIMQVSNVL